MKQEAIGIFEKLFIVWFRNLCSWIWEHPNGLKRTALAVIAFLFLNIFLLTASVKDFFRLKNALNYDIPSILYAIGEDGKYEPIAEYYKFSRIPVLLSALPEENNPNAKDHKNKVIQCFLSTEDNQFYSHSGIDLKGIARAFVVNILAGRVKEGASTITQQVARLKYLSTERSIGRKAREAWLAGLLELAFTKDQILEVYLNEIPLGHGTIGVGAASRFYFRKEIQEVTWGEAAILASLTTRPTQFSPLTNPISSIGKVRVVFRKLVENGRLTVEEAEKEYAHLMEYYQNLNRSPNDSAFSDRINRFPYVTEYIRKNLIRNIGKDKLYNGGLKIYSTIQIRHQEEAEKALKIALQQQTLESNQRAFRNIDAFDDQFGSSYAIISDLFDLPDFKFHISRSERTFQSSYQEELRDVFSSLNLLVGDDVIADFIDKNYSNQTTQDHLLPVEGSLIAMRPNTGYITAIVGGSGFRSDNQQIRSFQAFRQPGSSFKPILYAAALDYSGKNPDPEKNVTPATLFADSPLQYLMDDGDEWAPENYSSEYSGFVLLRKALEQSKNSVAVRVLEQIGLSHIMDTLRGLLQLNGRDIPYNFSVSLGSFELTPYELTRAYAALASGGKTVNPLSVLYVESQDGSILKDFRTEFSESDRKQVISPEAAFLITDMMADVIQSGTGKSALAYGLNRKAYGKTGTTNNFRDAWFVGYTPELVASVWIGYDVGTISLGRGVTGGRVSAPIWGRFMARSLDREPRADFPWAKDLNLSKRSICLMSGKLPGPQCREIQEESFITSTVPKEICNEHGGQWNLPDEPKRTNPEPKPKLDQNPIQKAKTDTQLEPKKKKKKKSVFSGDEDIDY
ncbi:membrane carboxypeptidase/Penicillin-binding protein [Leptospira ryugenii]|uniref:peptidoglycan glycosyltransferase n=1 Tax=Leptospira ryugenii TaxID=1917863 RepID=A0A2P2DY23_9LEPT|nr:PBP1A family penicillin-binding protein [Leptospira ryugenii]GBF49490.1 membrane carboxypeptidase/Penicillin-binding protein [Leptospira ryugenii]